MNRRSLLIRTLAAGTATGVAASGTPGQPGGPPAGARDQAVTLRYMTWYGADRLPTTQAWIAAFNGEWPRVTVEIEELLLADVPTKFQAQLAGGTPPDVILANSHAQTKWFDSGAHADLAPYLARDRIRLERDYALVGIEQWCGRVYFVPFFANSQRHLLQPHDAPAGGGPRPVGGRQGRLDDRRPVQRRQGRDARPGRRRPARPVGTLGGVRRLRGRAVHLDWGGDIADFGKTQYTVDSPLSMEGHKQLYDWLLRDRIIPTQADTQRVTQSHPGLNVFSAGKVAFHMRAVNDVELFQRTVKDAFEWDCLLFPRIGGRAGVNLAAGTGHSIVKDSKLQEQAWQLVRTISTDQGQEIMGTMLGLPAQKAKQEVWLRARQQAGKSPAHPRVWLDVFTRPYGVHFRHHTTREVQSLYGTQLNAVRTGQAALEPTLREANRQMNLALKYGECQPYKGITHPIQPGR